MQFSCSGLAINTNIILILILIVPRYLPAGNNTAIRCRQPTQLSQYCRCCLFLLSTCMSSNFTSHFKGAIADNLHHTHSPRQVDHYYCYTIKVHTMVHIFILSRYPGTMTVTLYFEVLPLLDVLLLLHSRNSYLCPEILSTNNIPRQARPFEQNIYITFQQNCSKKYTNIPIIELFVLRKL